MRHTDKLLAVVLYDESRAYHTDRGAGLITLPSGRGTTMDTADEAQPKGKRGRRRTYAKRMHLMLTDEQLDLVAEARRVYGEQTGRIVSASDIVRSAVEDGCKKLAAQASAAVTASGCGFDSQSVDRVVTEIEETRGQIRRVGINVNAMTKIAHGSGEVPSDLAEVRTQLDAVMRRLDGIEDAFIHADDDDG